MKPPESLATFGRNVHSQNGEDGIIAEVLRRISETHELSRWCVEFGAWDGVYLSNTCCLIRNEAITLCSSSQTEKIRQALRELPRGHGDQVEIFCRGIWREFVRFAA